MTETSRLGLLGFGLVGRRHVEAAQGLDAVTFTSRRGNRPRGPCGGAGRGLAVRRYPRRAARRSRSVDGIVIATPTLLHIEQARACVEAGCPVLVEKPIGVTSREAEATVALGRGQGRSRPRRPSPAAQFDRARGQGDPRSRRRRRHSLHRGAVPVLQARFRTSTLPRGGRSLALARFL